MSKTVDERVVEMRFDNSQFERNVSTSMSTLEKLKQSLKLDGAAKSLDSISASAKNFDMSAMSNGVETVKAKFSALEVMAVTALANITNSAVNAGKRLVSAFTIEPIKTGLAEYETQINSVQTILANTQSKGTTLDQVNAALDELNHYADMTIYNFTEMTRNIGTFTAAGVDLDKAVTSIKGIANLAAVSGSSSTQASTAMYQLSQALATGTVKLMDWNSVVNAGMGGQLFQDALKRTAEHMGYNVDALIKKYGSFRESLTQGEWLTAEVLTETLTQLSGAYSEADLIAQGYTESQAKEIYELSQTAVNAATKVKTFTQLMDTLKEAAQSGWTQTWEILIGDFEQAKELWTSVSDVFSGIINASAEARNSMLQGWADAGGRDMAIEAIKNAFEGLMSIIKPVKEAFREIFPPITSQQLLKFTEGLKNLTEHFKLNETQSARLKSTFKGLFAVVDIFATVITKVAGGAAKLVGHIIGLGDGVLAATGSFGDFLVKIRDFVKETGVIDKGVDGIVNILAGAIDGIKEFGVAIKDAFHMPSVDSIINVFQGIWDFITQMSSGITEALSEISSNLADVFGSADLFDVINGGLFAGILVGIKKFVTKVTDSFENVTGILDSVRGCLEAYQNQLNANALMKIAIAIGILAASLLVLSTIDGGSLARSLAAITVLFAELIGSLAIFDKLGMKLKHATKAVIMMIGMGVAINILASALKKLSSVDTAGIVRGLVAIGILMAEISIFLKTADFGGGTIRSAVGITILATAMLVMAKAVKDFGSMEWKEIGKGLAAIGGLLAELAIFSNLTGNASHVIATGAAMVLLGAAMKSFASVIKDLGGLDFNSIGKGLLAMGGALAEVTIAMNLMPKNMVSMGVGLIAVAYAMTTLAGAFASFGGMSWSGIAKGLVAMGGALAELAIGLNLMNGTLAGSAALLIAAGALAIFAPVLTSLGNMSWSGIAKGLVALAGAFAVIGIAGTLLSPLIPTLLGLSAAIALFGVAILGIGAGVALLGVGLTSIATGLTALAAAGAAAATSIVASLTVIITGILDLIPTVAQKLGEGMLEFARVIGENAPQLAESFMKLIVGVLDALETYAPQIVDSLMGFLIGIINSLAERIPELVSAAVNLIGAFFQGVVDALSGIDTTSLLEGIAGIGLLSGLMIALGAVASLIPAAMAGVLGMGVVIAELALVLAAVGAFAQIPGLEWLIGEGGNLLQTIGTAIGQFIGGIAGGIAEGATSTLPQIGSDLSAFMANITPFISGAKLIDASVVEGVKTLASAMLMLTGAELLQGITSFITGGSSFADFGKQVAEFGTYFRQYADAVSGIDGASVQASATAAKALTQLASSIPNSGGLVSLFTGDNTLADFAKQLVPFGKSMKQYSEAVAGLDATSISNSVSAAKSMAKLANAIPNSGGLSSLFSGSNDLSSFGKKMVSFGKNLKKYSDEVAGINASAVSSAVTAFKSVVSLAKSVSGVNFGGLESMSKSLGSIGKSSVNNFVTAFSNAGPKLSTVGKNMMSSLAKGIVSGTPAVNSAVNPVIQNMIKAVKSKESAFVTTGKTMMTKFANGIKQGMSTAAKAITSALSKAVSSARGYYSNFYNAGAYVAKGFANGISANTYLATAKARAMAKAAKDAAEKALGIQSPSKVFYAIGGYAGQGFINALADYESEARAAGSSIAKSATVGLSGAISKVKDLIEGGIDTQPTIRPVLDLSEVNAGAGAIDGLFGMQPSLGVMSNIGAISTMMNRNQNGTAYDVVSAIKDLKSTISKSSGNTYTINGITYDDGSSVANAIETLVRAARVEGRV